MNLYPETIESPTAKSQMALYCTPGLTLFVNVFSPIRGLIQVNGRCFAVGAENFYEIFKDGTAQFRGAVGNDFQPVTMATNGTAGNQVAICSAGQIFVFYLKDTGNNVANTMVGPVGGLQGEAASIQFCDGYGVAQLRALDGTGTNKFQVSILEDMTQWNPLSVQQVSAFSENIGAIIQVFRQLFVLGLNGHSQVYYNSGASQYTPFDVIQGAFMEEGISAPLSVCVLDNAPFWIGGNANGNGIAFRANGYTPLRISNFAIETEWATYPKKCTDAIGYSYRDQGHTFWVLRFPSANGGFGKTWVYDVAAQAWHERGYLSGNGYSGFSAHLSQCHAFAFGLHLVGDWNSGNIYSMAQGVLTDNGTPIRRLRRAPHISSEDQRIFHAQMQVAVEVGDAPQPPLLDGAGNARAPQMMLRWSDDSGRTWSNEHWTGTGEAGQFLVRAYWNRMGYARDRVYEVSMTDPVQWRIIDAYLRANPGFTEPTERYANQIAKMS